MSTPTTTPRPLRASDWFMAPPLKDRPDHCINPACRALLTEESLRAEVCSECGASVDPFAEETAPEPREEEPKRPMITTAEWKAREAEGRAEALAACPFQPGDRVTRRNNHRKAGTVRRLYTTRDPSRPWPAQEPCAQVDFDDGRVHCYPVSSLRLAEEVRP